MPSAESAMILTDEEWQMVANIMAYYLRTTPPGALAKQRELAERIKDAART